MYLGKNVLVAGGTGAIGIPLVRRLLEQGANVSVVSLDSDEYAKEVFGDGPQFVRADLTDYEACLRAVKNQDYAFNLVGIKGSTGIGTTTAASYFVPMLLFQTNLMEAAFRSGVSRYLFVSSICAYPRSNLHLEDNVWDGMPVQNDRYTGIAKRIGEIQGETYLHEHGWDGVRIVRPANVYGPFDDFNPATAQVIPALIRRMLDGEDPVRVWGDGTVVRDFIYSADVAEGMLLALEKAPPCVPINLGSDIGCTIKELAETIAMHVPVAPQIEWDSSKPTGDPVRLLSVTRAKELLGFEAGTRLDGGIQETIQWYLANTELANRRRGGLLA